MRTLFAVAALSVALSGFAIAPAAAQANERAAVMAACAGPSVDASSCQAAVAAFVRVARTLPAAQADALLAALVIDLAEAGASDSAIVANAIAQVAVAFNDPTRAATATQIAQAVANGQTLSPQIVQGFSSPS
jgi:hypothetical protein